MTTALSHRLLYAEQNWKQTGRLLCLLSLGYGVLGSAGFAIYGQIHDGHISSQAIQLAYYIPVGVIVYGVYRYYQRRARIEFGAEGATVYKLLRSTTIPYDLIRNGRVMTLRSAYVNGLPKYNPPYKKPFLDSPVLVLKFRGEPAQLAAVKKELGTYYTVDAETAAFPVPDAAAAAADLRNHMPERQGSNLGGAQRRAKRRR